MSDPSRTPLQYQRRGGGSSECAVDPCAANGSAVAAARDDGPWYLRVVALLHYILGALLLAPAAGTLFFLFAVLGIRSGLFRVAPVVSSGQAGVGTLVATQCGFAALFAAPGVACLYCARSLGDRTRRRFCLAWAVVLCLSVVGLPLGLATLAMLTRPRVVRMHKETAAAAPAQRARWHVGIVEGACYAAGIMLLTFGGLVLALPLAWVAREIGAASMPLPRRTWLVQLVTGFALVGAGAALFRRGRSAGRRAAGAALPAFPVIARAASRP
jgi:hypothetical protein